METRFLNVPSGLKWAVDQDGPFTALSGTEGLGWIKTKYADADDDWPDMQLQFIAGSVISDGGVTLRRNDGVSDELWNEYYEPISYRDSWSAIPIVLRPHSKGYLRLKSANPFDKPLIYANYFADERDLQVRLECVDPCPKDLVLYSAFKTAIQFIFKPTGRCLWLGTSNR